MLDPEGLYERLVLNDKKRARKEIVEEDGMPIGDAGFDSEFYGGMYKETWQAIEDAYEGYRFAKRVDVSGFWSDVRTTLENSVEMDVLPAELDDFEESLTGYSNVEQLRQAIARRFFNGD